MSSAAARIREIVAEVDEVWSDTRRLAFDLLSTRAVEFGLVERLQVIVEDGAARVGCEPRLLVTGPADALPEEMSHQLRAVAREAVLNVVLHAGASRFAVELDVGDAATELRVLDDGVGISKTQASGLGLRNLAARAADLEGTFGTAAAEGGGTVLRWAVPVCAQA